MSGLQQIDASDRDGILNALRADGGVIVLNYLQPEDLTAARAAIEGALEQVDWCNTFGAYEDTFFGLTTKRLHGVLNYGSVLERCLTHELALATGRTVLGEEVSMSTGEIMAIGPGEARQRLHRDGVSWERAQLTDEFLFSVNIAITAFTADNGATVVAPGSHQWPDDREAAEADLVPAAMPAGSALFYTGRLLHSGGSNHTEATRIGLYFGYIPVWLRPLENSVQTHEPDALQNLGAEAKRLLGLSNEGFVAYLR